MSGLWITPCFDWRFLPFEFNKIYVNMIPFFVETYHMDIVRKWWTDRMDLVSKQINSLSRLNDVSLQSYNYIVEPTGDLDDTYSKCLIWVKKWLDSTLSDSRRQIHIQFSHRNIYFATRKRQICLNGLIFVRLNRIFFSFFKKTCGVNMTTSVLRTNHNCWLSGTHGPP